MAVVPHRATDDRRAVRPTERELTILRLVADGFTNVQIAHRATRRVLTISAMAGSEVADQRGQ